MASVASSNGFGYLRDKISGRDFWPDYGTNTTSISHMRYGVRDERVEIERKEVKKMTLFKKGGKGKGREFLQVTCLHELQTSCQAFAVLGCF